ncbi:MAG: alpha-L-fucosidase, partial [Treponema sp.]|nr:alpha-L-fucosidase [Treponema sp.]
KPEESMVDWDSVKRETPDWFRDAKFGMFFHWGPYSVPACQNEWYSRNMYAKGLAQNLHHEKTYGSLRDFGYKDFYDGLTGEKFDADEWADLMVRAGVRYAGPVSEHADNFSLWDSRVNPVNCVNYGPKKDITGLCAEAFRRRNIKFLSTFHHQWLWGWFMSTDPDADVYDPANEKYYWEALPLETNRYNPARKPDARFNEMWAAKVEELVKKYQPDVIYFDSRAFIIGENYRFRVADYIHKNSRALITYKQDDFPQGVGIRDIERGRFADIKPFPWQTDDRLEARVTWCIVQEPKYRKPAGVIAQLCDVVSKNGNLLLNAGPRVDGSFHPEAVRALESIGAWLKVNGEAIYGARPFDIFGEGPSCGADSSFDIDKINAQLREGVISDPDEEGCYSYRDFRFTRRGNDVYAITFGWPDDRKISIRAFRRGGLLPELRTVKLLGDERPLEFTRGPEALEVTLPPEKPCGYAFALKLS